MVVQIVLYVLAGIIIGLFGINKKMGFWGYFFGSILLTPAVGLILLLVSEKRSPAD